ncbi:hypothetical protein Q7A53_14330 [Halobacillus rhizosphaerae]|uniref:hypothetical protein n=1 Tax=Halobacillus rhizosphaerae TaxID=3064889 RepID=UPI00398A88B3
MDQIQLQQRIIYFKAELDKYKKQVKDYQENFHYALLEKLKDENENLKEENNRLAEDLTSARESASKGSQSYENRILVYKENLVTLQNDNYDYQKRMSSMHEENKDLRENYEELQVKMKRLNTQYYQQSAELVEMGRLNISLKKELAENKENYEQKEKSMQNEINKLHAQLHESQHRSELYKAAKEQELEELTAQHKQEIEELSAHHSNEIEDLEKKYADMESAKDQEISRLIQSNLSLEEQINDIQVKEEESPELDLENLFENLNLPLFDTFQAIASPFAGTEDKLDFKSLLTQLLEQRLNDLSQQIDELESEDQDNEEEE